MLPPECAKRYRVERLLGQGAFGAVYRAMQVDLERPVAIKVVTAQALADPEQRERFRNEALITASLDHPNIVRVLDHGVADAQPWIAFELVEGGSLRDLLEPQGLALADALAIARDVLAALEHAHARGVLHRDVKPENVLRDSVAQSFKVTDFGIAKWEREGAVRTQTGVVMGTPWYLAPEQLAGQASPASDQYAWGVLLYELLSGQPPFPGDQPMRVLEQHLKEPPPPLADVPATVNALVMRTLAKNPEDRYPSATAALAALAAVDEAPPNRTVRLSRLSRASSAATVVSRVEPPSGVAGRTRGAAIAAGALAALIALTLARPKPVPPVPSSASAVAPEPDSADLERRCGALEQAEHAVWPEIHEISKIKSNLGRLREHLTGFEKLDADVEARFAGRTTLSRRALLLRARVGVYRFVVWSEVRRLESGQQYEALSVVEPSSWACYDASGLPRLLDAMKRLEDLLAAALPAGDGPELGEAFVLAVSLPRCFSPWGPVDGEKSRWALATRSALAGLGARLGPAGAPFVRWIEEFWSRRVDGLPGARGKRQNELYEALKKAWPVAAATFDSFKYFSKE